MANTHYFLLPLYLLLTRCRLLQLHEIRCKLCEFLAMECTSKRPTLSQAVSLEDLWILNSLPHSRSQSIQQHSSNQKEILISSLLNLIPTFAQRPMKPFLSCKPQTTCPHYHNASTSSCPSIFGHWVQNREKTWNWPGSCLPVAEGLCWRCWCGVLACGLALASAVAMEIGTSSWYTQQTCLSTQSRGSHFLCSWFFFSIISFCHLNPSKSDVFFSLSFLCEFTLFALLSHERVEKTLFEPMRARASPAERWEALQTWELFQFQVNYVTQSFTFWFEIRMSKWLWSYKPKGQHTYLWVDCLMSGQ